MYPVQKQCGCKKKQGKAKNVQVTVSYMLTRGMISTSGQENYDIQMVR